VVLVVDRLPEIPDRKLGDENSVALLPSPADERHADVVDRLGIELSRRLGPETGGARAQADIDRLESLEHHVGGRATFPGRNAASGGHHEQYRNDHPGHSNEPSTM